MNQRFHNSLKSRCEPILRALDKYIHKAKSIAVSPALAREQVAVTAGIGQYDSCSRQRHFYQLRRNVHRLEKGLTMKPSRKPFALDYINETVDSFCHFSRNPEEIENLIMIAWAQDVLEKYFLHNSGTPALRDLEQQFSTAVSMIGAKLPPRAESLSPRKVVLGQNAHSFDVLASIANQRHSVRHFQNKCVDREIIRGAVKIASSAPSACNRQPFRFEIVTDSAFAQQVAAEAGGTIGYVDSIHHIAVVVGDLSSFFDERDRHLIYIDASLASMLFILALEARNVSSCCINWPDVEEREKSMAKLLMLNPWERPVMMIAFGYASPDAVVPYSQKKSPEELAVFR